MNRGGAEAIEGVKMIRGAVTLVLCKAVAWVLDVELHHHSIAGDLGDYRGGGDTEALAIATDDTRLRQLELGDAPAIDQHVIGCAAQRRERAFTRRHRRPENIEFIDL